MILRRGTVPGRCARSHRSDSDLGENKGTQNIKKVHYYYYYYFIFFGFSTHFDVGWTYLRTAHAWQRRCVRKDSYLFLLVFFFFSPISKFTRLAVGLGLARAVLTPLAARFPSLASAPRLRTKKKTTEQKRNENFDSFLSSISSLNSTPLAGCTPKGGARSTYRKFSLST